MSWLLLFIPLALCLFLCYACYEDGKAKYPFIPGWIGVIILVIGLSATIGYMIGETNGAIDHANGRLEVRQVVTEPQIRYEVTIRKDERHAN